MKKARGRFIVLEGLDGAGTTTQAERLAQALRAQGQQVLTTREPSEGPVGQLLRRALTGQLQRKLTSQALALLFAADRIDHLQSEVLPALEAGTQVICDRYVLSSLAYQGVDSPMEWVATLNAEARAPDLTLFLEVDVATAAKRRAARGGAPELFEVDALQRKIAQQYQVAIRRQQRKERIVKIDGTLPLEQVTREALAVLTSRKWSEPAPRRSSSATRSSRPRSTSRTARS
jgi:dTMP kinase